MDDMRLDLLATRRAEAEQIDSDLSFLDTLANPGGEPPVAEPLQAKTKKAKALKPQMLSADNPPDHEQFVGDRKTVNGADYMLHNKTGVITDYNTGRATTDPSILAAFGKTKPTKLGQKTADALEELDKLAADNAKPGVLKTLMDKGAAMGADIAEGLTEAPEQIPGGISDAISAMAGVGDMLQELMPLPGFRIWDLDGNWSPAFASAEEVTADMHERQKTNQPFIPSISPKADTVTGGMVNGLSQFLAGFDDPPSFKRLVEFLAPSLGVWPGQTVGDCLNGIVTNGEFFGASPGLELEPGCLVAIADSAGVFQSKIFLGRHENELGVMYAVAQINPLMVRYYFEHEIVAMHRLWFRVEIDAPRNFDMKAAERFDCLFKRDYGSKCGAINPGWRPPECIETPNNPERIH